MPYDVCRETFVLDLLQLWDMTFIMLGFGALYILIMQHI